MVDLQRERLEQELRFLKESLAADIITREEYEKGAKRIETKIAELEGKVSEEEPVKEEPKQEEEVTIKEIGKEKIIVEKEPPKELSSENEKGLEKSKTSQKEIREEKPEAEEVAEEKLPAEEEIKEKIPEKEPEEKKPVKINKKLIAALAVIAVLIVLICIFMANKDMFKPKEKFIACYSDFDCRIKGKVGICLNPGKEDANCAFKQAVKLNLTIVNDENCLSCDTTRMTRVIKDLFPGVKINTLEYNSADGKKIVNQFNIDSLPAYIFDSKVNKTLRYDKFKQALIKKEEFYLIRNSASGANYYFKRSSTPNTLELFTIEEDTPELDKSLEEVFALFGDKINFIKTLVDEKEILKQEMGITAYPAFLVNNQLKFGGIQPPETIKNKFCELNKLDECSTLLLTAIN